jgi:hypothetical protein
MMSFGVKDILPLLLVAVDLVESLVCAWQRDYARAWYWLAAGQITFATVLMKR